ncbi:acyltransferase-domain-containing protein [Jimgerdemannia flammicorona]|uniref:Tafazzin family protein n=1 Tax=Jimgerdemannia flammicorona TaxID=994334 RepID=A0A433D583_9FUNG|nr:acyltransferase-domain-containing protein [Jimgerdemannia flammicorona]
MPIHHLRHLQRLAKISTVGLLGFATYNVAHIVYLDSSKPLRPFGAPNTVADFHGHDAKHTTDHVSSTVRRNLRYPPEVTGPVWRVAAAATVTLVGMIAKMFLWVTHVEVEGLEAFLDVVLDEKRTKPIVTEHNQEHLFDSTTLVISYLCLSPFSFDFITVANHCSVMDDPILWGLMPLRSFLKCPQRMRWVLAAADVCFTNPAFSFFFALGQTLPIVRGDGIYQPCMDYAVWCMRHHARWIHVFPESRVNQTREMIRWKWGVGRLVMEGGEESIVIPIWHRGMENIMRENDPFRPRLFQHLVVVFGDPVNLTDLLNDYREGRAGEIETRIKVTQRCREAVDALKVQWDDGVKYGARRKLHN